MANELTHYLCSCGDEKLLKWFMVHVIMWEQQKHFVLYGNFHDEIQ